MSVALVLVPLVPLVLALALWLPRSGGAVRRFAPWAPAPALVVAAFGVDGTLALPWLGLGMRLEMGPEARAFLLFGGLVWVLAVLQARPEPAKIADDRQALFFLLLAMAGGLMLPLATDPFGYLTGSALMTFAAYGLVQRGGDPAVRHAGWAYIILLVVADVLLFEALLLHAGNGPPKPLFAVLAVAGFGIKAGLAPLHVWLPLAFRAVPVSAAMALAAGHVGTALLGWQRFLPAVAAPLPALAQTVAGLGLLAVLLGLALGLLQRNPKVLLAYAGVAQVGVVALAVATALADPALWGTVQPLVGLYGLHYVVALAALLLAIPVAEGVQGRAARRRVLAGAGLAAAVTAGVPFSAGGDAQAHLARLWGARPELAPALP
ncbi:MAG TPA: proton-conducting transporter membrane subunit, partial [Gammaproteobacteria bacterium]|nr:proton-conducting transporter membrane subunit [Gammaproteobacteria bacterium]